MGSPGPGTLARLANDEVREIQVAREYRKMAKKEVGIEENCDGFLTSTKREFLP